jgi:hypothetical protein
MKRRGFTVTYTLNEEYHERDAKIMAKMIQKDIDEKILDQVAKFVTDQEPLDPEFAKVMDEMLTAKVGNKPTKEREW